MSPRLLPCTSRALAVAACVGLAFASTPAWAASIGWQDELNDGKRRQAAQDLVGAEACFRHALTSAKGADAVVQCMQQLADNLEMQNIFEEQLTLRKQTVKILARSHGAETAALVVPLAELGATYDREGDYSRAIPYYQRAVGIAEKNNDVVQLANCRHQLGACFFRNKQFGQAEEQYRLSLAALIQQQSLLSSHLLSAVIADYINLFRNSPDPGKSLDCQFQKAMLKDDVDSLTRTKGVTASLWGSMAAKRIPGTIGDTEGSGNGGAGTTSGDTGAEPHPVIRMPISSPTTGDAVSVEQINKQRVDFYERMIAIDIKSLGDNHPSVARDLTGLAFVHIAQKQYDEAKPLLARALQIYQHAYGDRAALVQKTESIIELVNEKQNNAGNGGGTPVSDYTAALPAVPPQARTLETALNLNYLAFLCFCHGRLDDAAKNYAWALSATSAACGAQSTLAASCLTDYGKVLRSSGHGSDAERYENDAYAIFKNALAARADLLLP